MLETFIELPAFEKYRADYLDDDGFRSLQIALIKDPAAGDVIEGAGGVRKLRRPDSRRRKGKRGGLRVIYYHWQSGSQFWLFTIYDKDEMGDLSHVQRKAIKERVKLELAARSNR